MEVVKNNSSDHTGAKKGNGQNAQNQGGNQSAQRDNREVEQGAGGAAVAKVKDTAATLLDQAKSAAGDAYVSATEKAATAIDEKKVGFAGEIDKAAQAARRIGGAIVDGPEQGGITEAAARYTETGAQKLEDFARYFETTDLRGISRDIEGYARRNPAVFIGAAFGLGILAARFIKSSAPATGPQRLTSKRTVQGA